MTEIRVLEQIATGKNLSDVQDREDCGGDDRQYHDHQKDMSAGDNWPVPLTVLRSTPVLDNFDSAFIHIAASRLPARERNRFGSIPRISLAGRDSQLPANWIGRIRVYRRADPAANGTRDELSRHHSHHRRCRGVGDLPIVYSLRDCRLSRPQAGGELHLALACCNGPDKSECRRRLLDSLDRAYAELLIAITTTWSVPSRPHNR